MYKIRRITFYKFYFLSFQMGFCFACHLDYLDIIQIAPVVNFPYE